MSEKLAGHPVLVYVTFVLPIVLLALGIVFKANVFLLILTIAWLGTAFIVLFLPVASDNGTSG